MPTRAMPVMKLNFCKIEVRYTLERKNSGSSQEFEHDLHCRNAFFAFWATSRIRIGLGYTKPFLLFSHQSVKRETISD